MKNAIRVWQVACNNEIGVDGDGDVLYSETRLGIVAKTSGVETFAHKLRPGVTMGDLQTFAMNNNSQTSRDQIAARVAVATFLRQWADDIEAGV